MSPAKLLKGDTKIKSWYDENGMDGLVAQHSDFDEPSIEGGKT
jgi:hypothetical protein